VGNATSYFSFIFVVAADVVVVATAVTVVKVNNLNVFKDMKLIIILQGLKDYVGMK
jgi:hypothetical protein